MEINYYIVENGDINRCKRRPTTIKTSEICLIRHSTLKLSKTKLHTEINIYLKKPPKEKNAKTS